MSKSKSKDKEIIDPRSPGQQYDEYILKKIKSITSQLNDLHEQRKKDLELPVEERFYSTKDFDMLKISFNAQIDILYMNSILDEMQADLDAAKEPEAVTE